MEVGEFRGRVMGCELLMLTLGASLDTIDRAVHRLDRLETLWTRFSPSSDISRINTAGGAPVVVAHETLGLLERMITGWQSTGGAFNPTILADLVGSGYERSRISPERVTPLLENPLGVRPLTDLVLSAEDHTVTAPAGFALDAGGIGKGYAADLVVESLMADGAQGALVSIGGDMAMGGTPPQPEGWIVDVEQADPAEGVLCSLAVGRGGVATSNTTSRRWLHLGRAQHHLIDPRTGHASTTDLVAVTVVAPTGWEAEVFAKCALLGGSSRFVDALETRALEGLAITTSGDVMCTYGLLDIELSVKEGLV